MSRKTEPAAKLQAAATLHQVNQVVEANNAREMALMQRTGGAMSPLATLEYKLEAFFETILGESRYMHYMSRYQEMRGELLDQWESAARQAEIQKGVADYNLVGADGAPLGTGQ